MLALNQHVEQAIELCLVAWLWRDNNKVTHSKFYSKDRIDTPLTNNLSGSEYICKNTKNKK